MTIRESDFTREAIGTMPRGCPTLPVELIELGPLRVLFFDTVSAVSDLAALRVGRQSVTRLVSKICCLDGLLASCSAFSLTFRRLELIIRTLLQADTL